MYVAGAVERGPRDHVVIPVVVKRDVAVVRVAIARSQQAGLLVVVQMVERNRDPAGTFLDVDETVELRVAGTGTIAFCRAEELIVIDPDVLHIPIFTVAFDRDGIG